MFGAGFFPGCGWLRLALDFAAFDGFGGFLFRVCNDFRGGSRGGGRYIFWLGDGGVGLLGDVGGRVEIGRGPVKGVEAAELFEFAVTGGDGAFGRGDFEAETGETAPGAGGGLVGAGQVEGSGAGGQDFVLNFDFDGLELVFKEEEADAAKALGLPLAGGEAVDDLMISFSAWSRGPILAMRASSMRE
ncbi:MAG: hypothetical protein NTV52_34035 [Acidobacteria bacterium]|nr:hypothetical protein [Acidobacteriota bacterium]